MCATSPLVHVSSLMQTSTHVLTESTPDYAVLDIQWTPHASTSDDFLAVATSTGAIVLYRLDIGEDGVKLERTCRKQLCEDSILVLQLSWHPSRPHIIGVTLSDGSVCLCESTEGEPWTQDSASRLTKIQQHSLEAWTLAFSTTQGSPDSSLEAQPIDLISGGDDIVLQRTTITNLQHQSPLWQDRKLHQAGITAILPLSDELILTGSYDDHIRLISAPSAGRRRVLAEHHLGGGVWRLKIVQGAESTESSSALSSALSEPKRYVSSLRTSIYLKRLAYATSFSTDSSPQLPHWGCLNAKAQHE